MLAKLGSRKLWVTLLTLAGVTVQGAQGAAWWQQAIVGLVAAAYVLVEGWADARSRANPLAEYGDDAIEQMEALVEGLKRGLAQGRELAPDGAPGDVGGLSSAAAINPQIVVALVQLVERIVSLFRKRRR